MKRKIRKKKYKALCRLILGSMAFFSSLFINQNDLKALPTPVESDPVGKGNITSYDKSVANQISITGTGNAFIKWKDFSLKANETLHFSGMDQMLNYVTLMNPSLIYGTINAADVSKFYIINPSGILFGPHSVINTNQLFVSTRSLSDTDITNYTGGGDNYDIFAASTPVINSGGLKSSDIMGTYDIADGDVMFLGKVQANSLKVEGNVIQIRNTQNFTTDGTTQLTDVTLISNSQPEVGYVVETNTGDSLKLQNTLEYDYDDDTELDKIAFARKFSLYLVTHGTGNDEAFYTEYTGEDATETLKANTTKRNYDAINALYNFYTTQLSATHTGISDDNYRILVMQALDTVVKANIAEDTAVNVPAATGDTTYNPKMLNVAFASGGSAEETLYNTTYQTLLTNFQTTQTNANYKYWRADAIEAQGEYMPNSANKLGWKAKKIGGSDGSQTIADYRLIQSANDLDLVNISKYSVDTQLEPAAGKVHGNYMLSPDTDNNIYEIDLSGSAFSPLGYNMDIADFASKSDMINFNGLNFTIKGLHTDTSKDTLRQGLFSIFNGTIKNLRLSNVGAITTTKAYSDNNSAGQSTEGGAGALIGVIGFKGGEQQKDEDADPYESGTDSQKNKQLNTTIKNVSVLDNSSGGGVTGATGASNAGGLVGFIGYGAKELIGHGESYEGSAYDVYEAPGTPHVVFENIENFGAVPSSSTRNVGGIVGQVNVSSVVEIENAINKGTISSGTYAGGFVGYSSTDSYLNKVSNSGSVSGQIAGGLVGYSGGGDGTTIKRSWNEGTISGNQYLGGIIGQSFGNLEEVFNLGEINGTNATYVGGLAGHIQGSSSIKNSYNTGEVKGNTLSNKYAGGIVGNSVTGNIENVYNSGTVSGYYAGGLVGRFSGSANIKNSYNVGSVSGTNSGNLVGYFYSISNGAKYDNVYSSTELGNDYGGNYHTATESKINGIITKAGSIADIWNNWSIDKDGTGTNTTWRVYANPSNEADTSRQPLLTTFLQDATIQRYNEANTVDPKDIVTVDSLNMHALHDSTGEVLDIRYKNTGKSTMTNDDNYNTVNADAVLHNITTYDDSDYTVSETDNGNFAVDDDSSLSRALIKSTQFGYNFKFDDETNQNDYKNDTNDAISAVGNTPEANMIYLKSGSDTHDPVDPKPKDEFIDDGKGEEDLHYDFTITVESGTYEITEEYGYSYTEYTFPSGNYMPAHTTTDNDPSDDQNLNAFTITGEILQDENANPSKTSVKITYDGKTYSVDNDGLKDNGDGTYTVTVKVSDHVYYNIKVIPGTVTKVGGDPITVNIPVTIQVTDRTMTDNSGTLDDLATGETAYTVTNTGDDDGATTISTLIGGNVKVVVDGDNVTLNFEDNVTVNVNGGTYTDPNTGITYTITKDATGTYPVYTLTTTSGNTTTNYVVTLQPGNLTNITNIPVTVTVADRTSTDGTLNNVDNEYTVTNGGDADGATVISTLINGNVEVEVDEDNDNVTLKFADNVTVDVNGGTYTYTDPDTNTETNYTITKDTTGANPVYTVSTTSGNTTTNYVVTLQPGDLAKITNIPVTITVTDRTMTDNQLDDLANGESPYTVKNTNTNADETTIANLLDGKVKVVVENGKVTLKLADDTILHEDSNEYTSIQDGEHTYTVGTDTYKITKTDTGYVYTVTDTATNTTTNYNIKLDPGNLTNITNIPVTIQVADRTSTDGTLNTVDNDYTVTNTGTGDGATVISNLIGDKVEVAVDGDNVILKAKNSTDNVAVNKTYTDNNNTTYTIKSKVTSGTDTIYTLTNTSGNTTTNYVVTLQPGDLTKYTNKNVTITANDGTYSSSNGLTVTQTDGKTYTVTDATNVISTLLSDGVLKVIDKDDNHTKTTVTFDNTSVTVVTETNDGVTTYKVTKGDTTYTITKTGDNTFKYTDSTNAKDQIIYTIEVRDGTIETTTPTPTPTPPLRTLHLIPLQLLSLLSITSMSQSMLIHAQRPTAYSTLSPATVTSLTMMLSKV